MYAWNDQAKFSQSYTTPALIVLSVAICGFILTNLHARLTPAAWLVLMVVWGWHFGQDPGEPSAVSTVTRSIYSPLLLVVSAAAAARFYKLAALPLGACVDEIFTLNSSLLLLEKPLDLFGHTLSLSQAWGKDHPNLYLYINLLFLKSLGVTYWTTKLLTVIPGLIGCAVVFLVAQRLFSRQVALATGLLFAFAHWSIRLNRYGWDVSIMILSFAIALWLLCLTLQSERLVYAYLSGIAAGLGLYSYLAARIVLLSLLVFWVLEFFLQRDRGGRRQLAFIVGAAAAGLPFVSYYLLEPGGFWARTSEVSVFDVQHPFAAIANNIVQHALMLHWKGGTFARDNVPGLPMMDIVTGLIFIVGLFILIGRIKTPIGRLVWCTLLLNFAGGVFSTSQEGGPYVYRSAAVIVPAFLVVGFGLEWLIDKFGQRALWACCSLAIILNLYLYFGLEAKNIPAMRVMAYEPRLIGLEISRDPMPVLLVSPGVLQPAQTRPREGEQYARSNPAIAMAPALSRLAIINFSGRYDSARSVLQNLDHPRDIYFVEADTILRGDMQGPAKIIFESGDEPIRRSLAARGASLRDIRDVADEPLLTVATLP